MAAQPQRAKARTEEASRRNAQILREVIARHEPKLLRQAKVNSQLSRDAEDALQEAYALFLQHYDGKWPALPFLMTTIKRCAWQIARKSSRRREISPGAVLGPGSDSDLWELVASPGPDPSERAERSEELHNLRAAFSELKPDEQRALLLLGAGLSYREIAELNSWTYTKVNRCIAEGRARLRELTE